jgi:sulfur-carrier protein
VPVQILYFASLREAVGHGAESIDLPDHVHTLADLAHWLRQKSPGHAHAFADISRLRTARDQTMADFDAAIGDAREIAFFPPVTGG